MKHHYIPEFYSKLWAGADGKVLRYRRLSDGRVVPKRLAPGGFGYRKNLYRAPFDDEERAQALELKFFRSVDDRAAKALPKLNSASIQDLPPQTLGVWWLFILSLFHRSPAYFESLRVSGQRHFMTIAEGLRENYAERRGPNDPHTFEEFLARINADTIAQRVMSLVPDLVLSENIFDYFKGISWVAMDAHPDCPSLLLSDDPLLRTNGLKREDGHLAIPLSPTRLLLGAHTREFAEQVVGMPRRRVFESLNVSTVEGAREFVAAVDSSQKRFISNRFGANLRDPII